ncbi:MAG: hypothetical protein Tp152SUR00d2C52646391_8 [Prokaryotic dsDNA virus sp.]|nr:MAG: hypothetical protein Tp152SUR00d2C52646391_8 [Prokaryotic dsDNA virus sp.]|tara:strand:+ start:997 stop:1380 length:384 start_codon:yes stop_codon:yes gene_type:complete
MQQHNGTITVTQEQFEEETRQLKADVERSDRLKELEDNPIFKELFLERYLKEEPQRITSLLALSVQNNSNNGQNSQRMLSRESLDNQLMGISQFAHYCRIIHNMGHAAADQLAHREVVDSEDDTTEE